MRTENRVDHRSGSSRRQAITAIVTASLALFAVAVWLGGDGLGPERDGDADDPVPDQESLGEQGEPLTWAHPEVDGADELLISEPGTYDLEADRAYVIDAPERIEGAVHLRGGSDIVWVGGHIHIPDQGEGPVPPDARRGLMITDGETADPGRTVHVEGLLIDGPDVAEGVNTYAPSSIVQLQNIHVADIHFRTADDRDGTDGWTTNHPDILQTWGSQAELRVDGLTGTSAYQGIFLKEDHVDRAKGPMWLRRIDITAIQHEGTDGTTYTGHRMFTVYPEQTGSLYLDTGTVFVTHHPDSGWNRANQNPADGTAFWRERYRDETTGRLVDEPAPGGASFSDALGNEHPDREGEDEFGTWAGWSDGPRDWSDEEPARVHRGSPPDGSFVPADLVGTEYRSPGYLDADARSR